MDLQEKLSALEEIMDVEEGSLKPEMNLGDLEEWDSLAALSYVVFMGDEFGKKMTGSQIRAFETVQDMLDTMKQEG